LGGGAWHGMAWHGRVDGGWWMAMAPGHLAILLEFHMAFA
jgi:hypothetical protein